jgi:hypothetical protein
VRRHPRHGGLSLGVTRLTLALAVRSCTTVVFKGMPGGGRRAGGALAAAAWPEGRFRQRETRAERLLAAAARLERHRGVARGWDLADGGRCT